ncbi:M81 family peptidase [Aliishimia ponticola]|uniref:Microcystinase C n=1 Tax=Aliishimia ponticola TaxID=2499833 RepID=A0A4S4N7V1_9RHOB|nr:M81 family metallopeptidase [Aliishimia ponticola]THH35169.1 M81 family peptidase [Aliishimia ponticola]
MKVLIGGLATETNTFSPIPTGRTSFEEAMATRDATQQPPNLFSAPLIEWRRMAEDRSWNVYESLCAFAQPAGITIRSVYEEYRDEILEDIRREKPDILLLSMHGAMIADGYDDCEGDTLTRARDILGPDAVIGLEIDPHNHLTEAMLAAADLIVMYKEYSHIDSPDRARELFTLAADTAEGKISPVMREYECGMMLMMPTLNDGPAKDFVTAMKEREGQDGVLSLSLTHSFPYGDHPRAGMRMLAICDGDADKAAAVAEEFGRKLWDVREGLLIRFASMEDTLTKVQAANTGGFVLADYADNAGGGAPSDSTFVLQEVLARGMTDVALGLYWDPQLVRTCEEAGVGANLRVRIGGKICEASGTPVDLDVTVRGIRHGMTQFLGKTEMEMGTGVWLEADGVHIVLSTKRTQTFSPNAFTDLGVPLADMKAVVVKSSNHFYAGFAPVAQEIIHMATPGTMPADVAQVPFRRFHAQVWPMVEEPFHARQ